MPIKEAQADMRYAYAGGSGGILSSGLIWLLAGVVALLAGDQMSILVFFFGGMLIHPMGILISKMMKRAGQHSQENPLSYLALESTLLLFIGLFIAYVVFQKTPEWYYPIMLLTIGGRYVLFQSLYGIKLYWALGFILVGAGVLFLVFSQPFHIGAIVGGVIELIFGALVFKLDREFDLD